MTQGAKNWRDIYEFDTPVVCYLVVLNATLELISSQIHISSSKGGEEIPELAAKAKKLMHRFSAEEVKAMMDEVEEPSA